MHMKSMPVENQPDQAPLVQGSHELSTLFVDLDGTLVKTDTLHESLLLLIKHRPLDLFYLPQWLLKGRAYFKQQIADRVELDPTTLPYHPQVIAFLEEQRTHGRAIVLATAADQRIANSVASHLRVFDAVLASDGNTNLSGSNKLLGIRNHTQGAPYSYIGDSSADLPIWQQAQEAYVVSESNRSERIAKRVCAPLRTFKNDQNPLSAALRAMRPHQWAKNLLVFFPLFLSHQLHDLHKLLSSVICFIVFSLCASAIYLINDMLDIQADRKHRTKCRRPIACGSLPIANAVVLTIVLMLTSCALALICLPPKVALLLAVYVVLTTAYSSVLKRRSMVDVICLAALYTHRLFTGGVAVHVELSQWLLGFSMFFFLSLAFAKRYAELSASKAEDGNRIGGRGYYRSDLEMIRVLGPCSGYVATLVMCLYINSPDVTKLYNHPSYLWLVCPVLLYWISRLWMMAHRQHLTEDPVVFAVKDRNSLLSGLLVVGVILLASSH